MTQEKRKTQIEAATKLINSLSWKKRLASVEALNPEQTILRVALADIGWTGEKWEQINTADPYAVDWRGKIFDQISEMTGTRVALARTDWFVFAASRPPLYETLLALPKNAFDLEHLLGIDVSANILKGRAVRAGFRGSVFADGSGVSRNNRMIERHETKYGAYWKSYDFRANTGEQDLFSLPLGPGPGPFAFGHAGGEIIFNLPNGLQAYLLVNNKGDRLDQAPVDIVQDSTRPDSTITNGISCMSCHSQGMRDHSDQVLGFANANEARFSKEALSQIRNLYISNDKMKSFLDDDRNRFTNAIRGLGLNAESRVDPIRTVSDGFEKPVTLAAAAAEIGLRPDDFIERLKENPRLQALAVKLSGAGVARDEFVAIFNVLVSELGLTDDAVTETPPCPGNGCPNGANDLLLQAISECAPAKAHIALKAGADVGNLGAMRRSLLSHCETVAIEVLPYLPDVELNKVQDGVTITHLGVDDEALDFLRLLLDRPGLDLTVRDSTGATAIHRALREERADAARVLLTDLTKGRSIVNLLDRALMAPLHLAATGGHVEATKDLAAFPGLEINLRDGSGRTALSYARQLARENPSRREYREIATLLKEGGGTE